MDFLFEEEVEKVIDFEVEEEVKELQQCSVCLETISEE